MNDTELANYYEILGVTRDASEAEVRKAYHKLAIHWHPDKNPDNTVEATRKFQLLQVAESTLLDPEKRAHYDYHLHRLCKERTRHHQEDRKLSKKEYTEKNNDSDIKRKVHKKKEFEPFHYHELKRREKRHNKEH
uniref:J domain-containing protein n=1 Tax=Scylla olivacea TaxID=85551 RepID=A0A0P4WJA9_SCYOL